MEMKHAFRRGKPVVLLVLVLILLSIGSEAGLSGLEPRVSVDDPSLTPSSNIMLAGDTKKESENPRPPSGPHRTFEFWFDIKISPDKTKKGIEFPPPGFQTTSETAELRYLILGSVDQRMALLLRLTDKAKARQINPRGFADYLYALQVRGSLEYLTLDERIFNLLIELFLYEIGEISGGQLKAYLQKLKYPSYRQDPEVENFNYLIYLLENNVFTSGETIDSLILLRHSLDADY